MVDNRIHTAALRDCAAKWPSTVCLKVPVQGEKPAWRDVTFAQFKDDVEFIASYWADKLGKAGAKHRAVVGVWLKGVAYIDLLHQWGLARAGYIPQLISLRMTDPTVVYQLLEKAQAAAIVHDESASDILKDSPVPAFAGEDVLNDPEVRQKNLPVPELWEPTSPEDPTMIFHTSGSTSGMPKLVPISASWNQHTMVKAAAMDAMLPTQSKQSTMVAIGSFSHMGSTMLFHQSFNRGGCYILPSAIPYPKEELRAMIEDHGLTMLCMFPPALSSVLHHARDNPDFLESIQKLEYLMYGGLGLDATDTAWAQEHGLVVVNVFGSTEVGLALLSNGSKKTANLEFLAGSKLEMIPIENDGHKGQEQLYELVVPPEALDCPDSSLRAADGKFHTGDLFAEVEPGKYTFKGRNDDWIKMEMALRCDTGSIEKNAMATCGGDLVDTVVVVGVGRPSPTLIVEPQKNINLDPEGSDVKELKEEIFKRIKPFHQRRYMHERIDDPRFIMVMPKGTLPRTVTKGNVRRKQTEEAFQTQLNQIYAC